MKSLDKIQIQEKLLEKLKEQLATPAYESWIKTLNISSINEKNLIISTDSNLGKGWIYKNCIDLIKDNIYEITGKNFEIAINVQKPSNDVKTSPKTTKSQPQETTPVNKSVSLTESNMDNLRSMSNNLNLKYTFDSFVIGPHNKFCHAAAQAVAKFPAKAHNPLFIYGGVGLGKTHLMQAVGHYILLNHPGLKIKYSSAEMFTNDLINSIRTDKMLIFRAKYRQIDVLLIDDIQFIEGKENTQEEIFHTFNTLYESGKQIILTSDRHPKNISTLTERLRSRFEWGILADIQVPELETRIAILRNKAERDNLIVPDDVLELIATAYQNNIRELEGALNRVIAYISINNLPLTAETVKNIINFSGRTRNLNIEKIIEVSARYFGLEPSEIKGLSRAKEVSYARQVAIYLARDMTNSSFPSIGDGFGGRKHTTILYSFEKMKEELKLNKVLQETVSEISKKITSDN
ncbi:MAG TPA: chromosomal replication initiator protein DnaA [Candidatus Gastranaerophilales bacterium]|nr:chromosomal replication initiator protein DnaA [Candidatus Gastranaerophilales bacterium]